MALVPHGLSTGYQRLRKGVKFAVLAARITKEVSIDFLKNGDKMFKKLESFLFGQVFGRMVARLAVSIAAGAAGYAGAHGVDLDPGQVSAALITLANSGYSALKEWRDSRAAGAKEPAK